ncbi:lysyl-tRNA synthetase, class II [Streptoalloteichus tenebrarius]|uniref:Lysine--tRNA ligase n=1 Tax=Streptoalloteichus tenebrarius (strain ATCC 17920 / DSM 40477 / JCM 4838 / CBS 697.72 / NBRC 16177 / NCIMB 11028 / NRRL B-12390 / A12253. 1 / ISP 5477) TaxID=1933 RepID=A0ABT1HW22_STRSD|nr:lysyl-tRNA synthetase, class II [Streptoalloteichus tenebrarius]
MQHSVGGTRPKTEGETGGRLHPEPASGTPVPRWKSATAGVVATVVQLAAFLSLLLIFVEDDAPEIADVVLQVFGALALPVDANVFIALVLAVLGAALRRRKRAALRTLLLFQLLYFAAGVLVAVLLWVAPDQVVDDPAERSAVLWGELVPYQALTVVFVVLLLLLRPAFPAQLARGAAWRALAHLVVGLALVCLVGWGLAELFPGTLVSARDKLVWVANQVTGEVLPLPRLGVDARGPDSLSLTLSLLGAAVGAWALAVFFRSARTRRLLSRDEELRVRELLAEHGEPDSLGYFATRRDKSVIFSPCGRAAVTYRVLGGTSLASADPVGEEEHWPAAIAAWLAEARQYGWACAALGASERGAHAYRRAGLKALEIGDEAILDVRDFSLTGRDRRAVRQAINRVERAGYQVRVRRHGEIPPEEMAQLLDAAQRWRGAETERGFSMALGRLGDPTDERNVMVEAYDARGRLRGLLSFVPWGRRGLSLDLMRRDRAAENGLNEFMVCGLVAAAGTLGVQRVSLNFAMFRAVFEEGARIGAGPVLRTWRALLGLASRFFQLESLYRSNAKYGPAWQPRFLCFARTRQLVRVSLVAGAAEGFVPSLRSLLRRGGERALGTGVVDEDFVRQVREIDARALEVPRPRRRPPEQVRVRLSKVERLRRSGVDPYPAGAERGPLLAEVRERFAGLAPDTRTGETVTVAGRVVAHRELGRLAFAVLRDFDGELQVMLSADVLGADALADWRAAVDLGDLVSVRGEVITTRRGELSVAATDWTMTAKCLHPLPDKRKGLGDPEARVRQRYLDLVVNPESRQMLRARSSVVRALRDALHSRGYLEVETPMLQRVHGGANARPFVTHINAYDMRMYLRIAPELYLKRLCVAGVDRVFELNRNFRNEGVDATHNPEFTMLEAYQAYADYTTMLHMARELIQEAAVAAHGAPVARRPDANGVVVDHDLGGEWPVVGVHEAVSAALGEEITPDTELPELRRRLAPAGVAHQEGWSRGQLLVAAYEHLVEPHTTRPTFYRDFPTEVSPLTRQHRDDPRLAERWDLVAFGAEIATAYTELTDPLEQRDRLFAQSLRAASGDVEAMELDEDFLTALEHGMPPTGGMGMGVDRLVMMLTGASIRQTVLFPFVRPAARGNGVGDAGRGAGDVGEPR